MQTKDVITIGLKCTCGIEYTFDDSHENRIKCSCGIEIDTHKISLGWWVYYWDAKTDTEYETRYHDELVDAVEQYKKEVTNGSI